VADFTAQELRVLSLFSPLNDAQYEQLLSRHLQCSHGPDQPAPVSRQCGRSPLMVMKW